MRTVDVAQRSRDFVLTTAFFTVVAVFVQHKA